MKKTKKVVQVQELLESKKWQKVMFGYVVKNDKFTVRIYEKEIKKGK